MPPNFLTLVYPKLSQDFGCLLAATTAAAVDQDHPIFVQQFGGDPLSDVGIGGSARSRTCTRGQFFLVCIRPGYGILRWCPWSVWHPGIFASHYLYDPTCGCAWIHLWGCRFDGSCQSPLYGQFMHWSHKVTYTTKNIWLNLFLKSVQFSSFNWLM